MAPSKTHCSNCYTKGHRVWKCSKPRAVTKCPERHEDYIKWYAMKMEDKGQVNLVDEFSEFPEFPEIDRDRNAAVLSTPHGHQTLAISRAVMAFGMRKEGVVKLTAPTKSRKPTSRPCVFEIGAGATGVKSAVSMRIKYTVFLLHVSDCRV